MANLNIYSFRHYNDPEVKEDHALCVTIFGDQNDIDINQVLISMFDKFSLWNKVLLCLTVASEFLFVLQSEKINST